VSITARKFTEILSLFFTIMVHKNFACCVHEVGKWFLKELRLSTLMKNQPLWIVVVLISIIQVMVRIKNSIQSECSYDTR